MKTILEEDNNSIEISNENFEGYNFVSLKVKDDACEAYVEISISELYSAVRSFYEHKKRDLEDQKNLL